MNFPRGQMRLGAHSIGIPLVGALAGAVFGLASLAILGLLVDGPGGFPYVWDAFTFVGVPGFALGVVAFPVARWGILRHVPLGRVVAETGAGTLLGALAGSFASGLDPLMGLVGALLGFCLGAIQLRARKPAPNTLLRSPSAV